ncbi:peptidase S8/S53 domain-containing protein [Lactarius quietus]|nr:peptidase S8/S53 domain-containing protein [Lactarius quietus]
MKNEAAHSCFPYWDDIHVKHTWDTVPSNWETLGPPFSNTTIDLHIALRPQYEDALIGALYEVSTPGNPKHVITNTPPYGAHLSKEQVAQLVAPHRDTLDLINSWLKFHGIPRSSISVSHGGGWLTVAAVPVFQANEMLGASYQLYRESGTNDTSILRTISYALPAVLHEHVRTVVPTTYFASTHTPWQSPRGRSVDETAHMASRETGKTLSSRDSPITPRDLSWLYRTSAYIPAATDKNALGIVGYARDYPNPADLRMFMSLYRTNAIDATYKVVRVNGGEYNPRRPSVEGNQNIQYASAMVYPTPVTFYSVGGSKVITPGTNEPAPGDAMLEWLHYVISQPDVPKTISTSYSKYEKNLPLEYATALCNLGNEGVGYYKDCQTDGDVQFIPEFPASCTGHSPQHCNFVGPYVTSVGGTTSGTSQGRETAAVFSGGGFSNYFPRPPYQREAVPKFLDKLGSQYAGMYNAHGRGIPDISAQAIDFIYIKFQERLITSGTSSATPTAAGVISLLNDYLISTDRAPLGFLNPLLYDSLRRGLNDIKSGSNPGCNTPGFSAIRGWDPVTGLGTPDFVKLQTLRNLMDGVTHSGGTRTTITERLNNNNTAVHLRNTSYTSRADLWGEELHA